MYIHVHIYIYTYIYIKYLIPPQITSPQIISPIIISPSRPSIMQRIMQHATPTTLQNESCSSALKNDYVESPFDQGLARTTFTQLDIQIPSTTIPTEIVPPPLTCSSLVFEFSRQTAATCINKHGLCNCS